MTQVEIKRIAQERIKMRQEYNIKRLQSLFADSEIESDKVIIPHEKLVEARHNDFPQFFEHVCKKLNY